MAKKEAHEETDRERIDRMAKEAGHGSAPRGGFSPPEHKAGVPATPKDEPPKGEGE